MSEPYSLRTAARKLVHIDHMVIVLREQFPRVYETLLVAGYAAILWALHSRRASDDPAFAKALKAAQNPGRFKVVRGEGVWLTLPFMEEVTLSRTGAKQLPAFRSPIDVDRALSPGTLPGFKPIRPVDASVVLGPFVTGGPTVALGRRSARPGQAGPVDVGRRPSPSELDEAWSLLEEEFPGIDRGYFSLLVASVFRAQRGDAPPPVIVVTGATGSGKGGTQHIVAAAVGGTAQSVRLTERTKDVARSLGLALGGGASLVYVDEVGRSSGVYAKLEPLLAIHRTFRFDVKYGNEREVVVTAPISLLGSTLPMAITRSPELSRRAVGIHLSGEGLTWHERGSIERLRNPGRLRAAATTVVSHLWWMVHDAGPNYSWKQLAIERFGAAAIARLDPFEPEYQEPIIRRLYHLFMNARPADLSNVKPGWYEVRGRAGEAFQLLDELLVLDDEKKAIHGRRDELGRLDLRPILGFKQPALKLHIERRSRNLTRFKFAVGGMRGHGPPKETWPRLSADQVAADNRVTAGRRVRLRVLSGASGKTGEP